MASLRTAMDSAFWDLNLATSLTLDGIARSIPGEPVPLDGARASRALRIEQLSLLGKGFPLGIIPSYSPPASQKELGSFSLQSLWLKPVTDSWWLGLIGQVRPNKIISSLKAEVYGDKSLQKKYGEDWEILLAFKDVARHFMDKSFYSIGLCSQLFLKSSSLLLSTEKHGDRERGRTRAMLLHKLPSHDISFEAAWPELFIDHNGKYWNVPSSISLDCLSLVSESGLRYRFGIHTNYGRPQFGDSVVVEAPPALMPGLCAKAAFSYEKSKDLWRRWEKKKDLIRETEFGRFWRPAYDVRLREPHATISGIIGGNCGAWVCGAKNRSRLSTNLFGSVCCTFQHGKFRKLFGDLTRVEGRLDISSASALAKMVSGVFRNSLVNNAEDLLSPRLNLIFQQQVIGPVVFRVDSRFLLDSSSGRRGPHTEDIIYSLNYYLRLLQSGKVVAWYSPKRKEGMIELRLWEF